MKRTIISHDTDTAIAVVRFEHNGVTVEDSYDLKQAVPGTMYIFEKMGIEFTQEHQLTALDRLTESIETSIDAGHISQKSVETEPYVAPPSEPEEE